MPTGTLSTDGPPPTIPAGIGSNTGTSFWTGNATLLTTTSATIETNSGGAVTAQMRVGLVGPASEAGVLFGDISAYRASATQLATTADVLEVNADAAAGSQAAVGAVGTGSRLGQPGIFAGLAEFVNYTAAQWIAVGTLNCLSDIIAHREDGQIVSIGAVGGKAGIAMGADGTLWRDAANVLATHNSFKLADATSRIIFGDAGQEQTTVGAAGGASALPAAPTKYFKVVDSAGTTLVVPAYAAA